MPLPLGVYRADHVGSFLRPPPVLEARHAGTSGAELRKIEDEGIAKLVSKQREPGIRSITDGEARRLFFHIDFLAKLKGVEARGNILSSNVSEDGWTPPKLVVTGKLGRTPEGVQVEDYKALKKIIDASEEEAKKNGWPSVTPKVCIPSPTMVHFRGGRASIDIDSYPDLDVFFEDLARVYREELQALYDAGARFVQMDDTNLAYLCDEKMREAAKERGEDVNELPRRYVELINAAISQKPKDLNIGIHLCRGNYRSSHFASGSYAPVAEVLFSKLNVDVFFLEYDDERSGDFGPLRLVSKDKVVVLGLMSSKLASLDDEAAIKKRIEEARGILPGGLGQICLSHQCGFGSTSQGNRLSEDEQWAKVRLMTKIAKDVWGPDTSQ